MKLNEQKKAFLHTNNWKLADIFNIGVEREMHRMRCDNQQISNTPTPFENVITNRYFTNDYSESQLEIITPICQNSHELINYLKDLHNIAYQKIDRQQEWFYPDSNLPDHEHILEAQFNKTNNAGAIAKNKYRQYLSQKYGQTIQIFSGIHFNVSFKKAFLQAFYDECIFQHSKISFQQFQDDIYFHLYRNYLKYGFLITFFFGKTPLNNNSHLLQSLINPACKIKDVVAEDVISIRQSQFGYVNFENLNIQLDNLAQFKKSVQAKITDKTLINIQELYAFIRLKPTYNDNLTNVEQYFSQGIQYVELRNIDIDPRIKEGINEEQTKFILLFLLWLFVLPSDENYNYAELINNFYTTALCGQNSTTTITWNKKPLILHKVIDNIFHAMTVFYKELTFDTQVITLNHATVNDLKLLPVNKIKRWTNSLSLLDIYHQHAQQAQQEKYQLFIGPNLELSSKAMVKKALEKGISVDIYDDHNNLFYLQNNHIKVPVKNASIVNVDNLTTYEIMKNKILSNRKLSDYGFRVPFYKPYYDLTTAQNDWLFWKDRLLVVKPCNQNFGVGITIFQSKSTPEAYQQAVQEAFQADPEGKILIQDYVQGTEYRFLVINYKLVSVIERQNTNIYGDGIKTVRQLIDIVNQNPARGDDYSMPFRKIIFDQKLNDVLANQQVTLNTILPVQQKIALAFNSNVSTGGLPYEQMCYTAAGWRKIAEKISQKMHSKMIGIDLIIPQLRDFNKNNYYVLEINHNPALAIHTYAEPMQANLKCLKHPDVFTPIFKLLKLSN